MAVVRGQRCNVVVVGRSRRWVWRCISGAVRCRWGGGAYRGVHGVTCRWWGASVVMWRMWGPAGCWCRISEVSGVGVGVVLTEGVTLLLVRCDAVVLGTGMVTWRM